MTPLPHVYVDREGELWIFDVVAVPQEYILWLESAQKIFTWPYSELKNMILVKESLGLEWLGEL